MMASAVDQDSVARTTNRPRCGIHCTRCTQTVCNKTSCHTYMMQDPDKVAENCSACSQATLSTWDALVNKIVQQAKTSFHNTKIHASTTSRQLFNITNILLGRSKFFLCRHQSCLLKFLGIFLTSLLAK